MIDASFVESIRGLVEPRCEVISEEGKRFVFNRATGELELFYVPDLRATTLEMRTLNGLVDYVNEDPDGYLEHSPVFLHVESPSRVSLLTQPLDDEQRTTLAVAKLGYQNSFRLGVPQNLESFITGLQSAFVDSESLEKLIATVSSIDQEEGLSLDDDGISQRVVVRAGASSKHATIKNPIVLRMYQTFHEVEQPAGQFILRIKKSDAGPALQLSDADCLGWEGEAVQSITEYLKAQIKTKITILR